MTRKCHSCGKESSDDSLYCNWCGKRIDLPPPRPTAETKACPHCGAANPMHVTFCQNCAKDFNQPPVAARPSPAAPSVRKCGWCGAPVGPTAVLCHACGRDPAGPPVAMVAPRQPSNGPTIAAVLFVGAAILDFVSGVRVLTADGYLPEFGIDLTGMLQVCGTLCILFGLSALVAASLSYLRVNLALAIVAGALGMVGGGPFGIGALLALIGLVFVIRGRDEFTS